MTRIRTWLFHAHKGLTMSQLPSFSSSALPPIAKIKLYVEAAFGAELQDLATVDDNPKYQGPSRGSCSVISEKAMRDEMQERRAQRRGDARYRGMSSNKWDNIVRAIEEQDDPDARGRA